MRTSRPSSSAQPRSNRLSMSARCPRAAVVRNSGAKRWRVGCRKKPAAPISGSRLSGAFVKSIETATTLRSATPHSASTQTTWKRTPSSMRSLPCSRERRPRVSQFCARKPSGGAVIAGFTAWRPGRAPDARRQTSPAPSDCRRPRYRGGPTPLRHAFRTARRSIIAQHRERQRMLGFTSCGCVVCWRL